jgi:SAM-dependent methyltransferase
LGDPSREGEGAFDRIGREFDLAREAPWEFVVDWLRGLECPPGPLLDLGCGNGRHMQLAGSMGYECVGVDASAEMLATARRRLGPTARLVRGDARAVPLGPMAASVVLCVAVVHHIRDGRDRARAVLEVARALRPGGHALISVWALDDPGVAARARARPEAAGGGGAGSGGGSGGGGSSGGGSVVDGGDGRDLLVPWRASPGGPVDRYYRAIGTGELAALCGGAGLEVAWAGERGANHVVSARRPLDWHPPRAPDL